ncbi:unnamed protein product [Notodromas monacha]|uniref:Tetraspanin n=1 Tax=Notodromas monacha TaxID=399045 RepID=A0A7R9BWJ8_9CRUS|nr:unnamed protein product [Notodromas monacha]CAG0922116.1 unnamed protein product [Notodromas monacha]
MSSSSNPVLEKLRKPSSVSGKTSALKNDSNRFQPNTENTEEQSIRSSTHNTSSNSNRRKFRKARFILQRCLLAAMNAGIISISGFLIALAIKSRMKKGNDVVPDAIMGLFVKNSALNGNIVMSGIMGVFSACVGLAGFLGVLLLNRHLLLCNLMFSTLLLLSFTISGIYWMYETHAPVMVALQNAVREYSFKHPELNAGLDIVQTQLRCCGVESPGDWLSVVRGDPALWQTPNISDLMNLFKGVKSSDDWNATGPMIVPKSCCSPEKISPSISKQRKNGNETSRKIRSTVNVMHRPFKDTRNAPIVLQIMRIPENSVWSLCDPHPKESQAEGRHSLFLALLALTALHAFVLLPTCSVLVVGHRALRHRLRRLRRIRRRSKLEASVPNTGSSNGVNEPVQHVGMTETEATDAAAATDAPQISVS